MPSTKLMVHKTLLHILEHSKEPAVVYISAELHIGFINKAMMNLWRKTTSILDQRLIDAAPEFEPLIPILREVWNNGSVYIAVDTPAKIHQHGELVERYFDFEYRPVLDDEGKVIAIINTATDVTDRMNNARQFQVKENEERELRDELIKANNELLETQKELAEINLSLQLHLSTAEEKQHFLQRFIMQAPAALTLLRGSELVYEILNPKYQQLMPGRNLEGRPIFEAVPELVGTPLADILKKVYHEGTPYSIANALVPLSAIEFGPTVDRYFTFNFVPWFNDEGKIDGVMNLAYEVTDEVNARKEVAVLNDQLQKVNGQLTMATEAARIGTWFIDPASKALTYNNVLAEIFGYEEREPMTYDDAIAQVMPDFREYLVTEIERAISNGNYYDVIYQQQRFNDGAVIWLRSTGRVTVNKEDGNVAFSGVVQDITSQRQDEQRKDTFIGMVSHELKTPLTSLSGFVQIMGGHAVKTGDSFAASLLQKTGKQISKMTKIINGFLNVSRLESGHINIDKTIFHINDLLRESEEESRLIFPGNEFEFAHGDNLQVLADKDKIGQVINNLISNAVKYSPPGSKVDVSFTIDATWLTVSVCDQGAGIQPKDREKLFTRYYRVDNQAMKTISGFGIGLYLCKEIIERHGGQIGVNSGEENGSKFWFKLPLS